jgi:hypothetical protein
MESGAGSTIFVGVGMIVVLTVAAVNTGNVGSVGTGVAGRQLDSIISTRENKMQ